MPSTFSQIATSVLSGGQTSYQFTSIPQIYSNLVVIIDGSATTISDLSVRCNGDSSAIYSRNYIFANGSIFGVGGDNNAGQMNIAGLSSNNTLVEINFPQYSSTVAYKPALARGSFPIVSTNMIAGQWQSTAAITAISFTLVSGTINAGTRFSLYGIKGV